MNDRKETAHPRAVAFLLAVYFLGGGTYTFVTHGWFPAFPPPFDLLKALGGVYTGAGVAMLLGLLALLAALRDPPQRHADRSGSGSLDDSKQQPRNDE